MIIISSFNSNTFIIILLFIYINMWYCNLFGLFVFKYVITFVNVKCLTIYGYIHCNEWFIYSSGKNLSKKKEKKNTKIIGDVTIVSFFGTDIVLFFRGTLAINQRYSSKFSPQVREHQVFFSKFISDHNFRFFLEI